ncbi:uncharacterized protein VNE69_06152 [Vairimorpha necatrix]|uniref:Membrane protein n=1 Tax=Vairimorpha necatrix TaxID=6039 RepID=A0AAX4JD83_9MICR
MKFLEHVIYLTLYFSSLILDMLISKYALNHQHSHRRKDYETLLSKYLLTFTKFLFIMEMAFYSGFYFIKSMAFRLQILLCRGFSFLFVIFLGIINEFVPEIVIAIVVNCITIIFLVLTMNEDNQVVYHMYNKRAGIDYLKFKLYIVEEMISTSKKATLIFQTFLIMQDFFTNERHLFYVSHAINFVCLVIDYIVYNSKIDKEDVYIFSYILIITLWIFLFSYIIILLCFFKIYVLVLLYILESCYTLIVILFLIRINITRKIEKLNAFDGSYEVA